MYKRHTQYRTCRSLCFLLKSSSPFSFHMLPFPQNVDPRTGDMLKDTSRSYHMCLTTKPHLTVCFSWICQCKRKLNHGPLCSLASFRIDRHASIRCCFHLRSGNVHECQRVASRISLLLSESYGVTHCSSDIHMPKTWTLHTTTTWLL